MLKFLAALLLSIPGVFSHSAEYVCPDGGEWHGHAPPDGDEFYCAVERGGEPIKHGWSVSYHPSGTIEEACEYRDGARSGRCSFYGPGGQLTHRGRYEQGKRTGYHWYWTWGLNDLSNSGRSRAEWENTLAALEIPDMQASALAQHLLDHGEDEGVNDVRNASQVCCESACASAAVVEGRPVLAVQFDPPPTKVAKHEGQCALARTRASTEKAAEQRAEKARERKRRAAQQQHEKAVRRWHNTHVRCSDGSRSPSCTCGGSTRGCCSHHGGVSGCPREFPRPPAEAGE